MVNLTGQAGDINPAGLAFDSGTHILATVTPRSTVTLWDTSRVLDFVENPVVSACRITSSGGGPRNWATDIPGIADQPEC